MRAASAKTVLRKTLLRCRSALPAVLLLPLPSAIAPAPVSLPVLHTARQVHALSFDQAARGYPIHLAHAQVTYDQPSLQLLFLTDCTGGVYARARPGSSPALHAGEIVAVDGLSGPGIVAPAVKNARFRVLGHAPLPAAPLVSFDRLSTGAFDSRWVMLEGIVRSIEHPTGPTGYAGHTSSDGSNLILKLASGEERLDLITRLPSGPIPLYLLDAKVRFRATVGSRFNQRNQFVGAQVFMPDLSFLQVVEPAPRDPFALPLSTIGGVARIAAREPGHRIHIRGVVTSTFDGQHFSVRGPDHGIFVATQDSVSVQPGDLVDVAGFPSNGDYTSYLDVAVVRRLGSAPLPQPLPLTAAQLLSGAHDAESVQLDAALLEVFHGPNGVSGMQLSDAGVRFRAVLSPDRSPGILNTLRTGSQLRVRGICVVHTNSDKIPESFDLLLRSPADVRVLHAPPWWTPRHTLLLAATLGVLVLIIATRNAGLHRRVAAQTRQIQAQLDDSHALRLQAEAATHEKSQTLASLLATQQDLLRAQEKLRYQATHDILTGLWNRAALLDFLPREIERAQRTRASLGILLLDIDHFKRVNDTHGHLAGDAVLREIGLRITRSIRPYDIAGRYGGEEFLILLPDCNSEQIESSAERIRLAIDDQPFHAGDALLSLTASIGATAASGLPRPEEDPLDSRLSDAEFLSRADVALYQAKSAGRNRTVLSLPRPVTV